MNVFFYLILSAHNNLVSLQFFFILEIIAELFMEIYIYIGKQIIRKHNLYKNQSRADDGTR